MRLPITVHRARLGKHSYRVIRPRPTPPNVVLRDFRNRHDEYDIRLDAHAAHRIGVAWLLAARSPRSLVHIPLRGRPTPVTPQCWPRCLEWCCPPARDERQLDLLLLHRGLQFRPSRWKEVRARLDSGRPETAELPASDAPDDEAPLPFEEHWMDQHPLRQHVYAETLLLTGNAPLFRELSTHFLELATRAPRMRSLTGKAHHCNELRFHQDPDKGSQLHITYADRWSGTDIDL
ncbi:hypothetical protein SAMN04487905_11221 [Actinopolyspora xinjiangensis]|uniref:Uncharacterized protein n=1 Tax=Actinopolyspora xinjiangensis TaxID=405564 RepID=A0A1H0WFX2_9ACTN|nr:hypothetical protein [Actinopolyspora xinjiangensis]SDP89473.1 hypothetical protein SAMN04487905_11221 [Actinopolyspora xinjiangensis]